MTNPLGQTRQLADAANSANGIQDKVVDFSYSGDELTGIARTANLGAFRFDTDYRYDGAGRLAGIMHSKLSAVGPQLSAFTTYGYQYDAAHRITGQATTHDTALGVFSQLAALDTETFGFDAAGQLTQDAQRSYQYDANGNRTTGGVVTGDHNRLTEDADYTYTYDNEGNLTRRTHKISGSSIDYTWDHRNRLINVLHGSSPTGPGIFFRYNANDQLVHKQVLNIETPQLPGFDPVLSEEHYVVDGAHRVLTYSAQTGELANRYVRNPLTDQLLTDELFDGSGQQLAETYWAATDHLGSVHQLLDGVGAVVEHREYDSFGAIDQVFSALGYDVGTIGLQSDVAHAGRFWDDDVQLYQNRARWYDPAIGRFISEDPIGFADGPNVYRYAGNDPVNFVDPTGLSLAAHPLSNFSSDFGASRFDNPALIGPVAPPLSNTPVNISSFSFDVGNPLTADPFGPSTFDTSAGNSLQSFFANERAKRENTDVFTAHLRQYATDPIYQNRIDSQVAQNNIQFHIDNGTPQQAFTAQFARTLNGVAEGIQGGAYPFLAAIGDAEVVADRNASFGQRAFALGSIALEVVTAGQAPNVGTLARSFDTHTAAELLTSRSFTTQIDTFSDTRVLSQVDTLGSNRGLTSVLEGRVDVSRLSLARQIRTQLAQDFEDSLIGAASDIATRRRIVPALNFKNSNPRGNPFVRFDGVDPTDPFTVIDRKLNVTTLPGQIRQLQRQSDALQQNPGFNLRFEVPNAQAASNAQNA
ncbi:MAG: hypothetical protein MI725_04650, partial [Pirellulales bacterium]|nr:hypothetical protein [Pirellulales bacterium]